MTWLSDGLRVLPLGISVASLQDEPFLMAAKRPVFLRVPDRRATDRTLDPWCRVCGADTVKAILRTVMVIYYRCHDCNIVWGEPKPRASHFVRGWLESQHARLHAKARQRLH